jgi:GT2 family glycosyltransferase
MPVTISAVIPVYNGARHLAEALESVRAQTRGAAEVIVADDCSTDVSGEIAAAWGATVIRLVENGGPARARNAAIRLARGEAIAFLDADDRWAPDHLERVAGMLDRFPDAIVGFGGVQRFGARTGRKQPSIPAEVPTWMDPLLLETILPQGSVVVRRTALDSVGGYAEDLRYAEDYDLWLRLARRGRFVATHAPTLHYRLHDAQSSRALPGMFEGAWRARARALAALELEVGAADRATLRARLLRRWQSDLRDAWHFRGREPLATVLAQHSRVPDSDAVHRRWVAKVRWERPFWRLGAAAWDRAPAGLRDRLNQLRNARPARPEAGPRAGQGEGRRRPGSAPRPA